MFPYPNEIRIPTLDQITCPNCGEKRILYWGNDPTIMKMILSNYGITKDMNEEITNLKTKIDVVSSRLYNVVADSKEIMTNAMINAFKETIHEHEKKYHNVKSDEP